MIKRNGRSVHPIILLVDGDCAMCRTITRFVAKRDSGMRFRFVMLDSAVGREWLSRSPQQIDSNGTFVLVHEGRYWTRSDAALQTVRNLDGAWPLLYGCLLVPTFLRNRIYDWIALHRHRWPGGLRGDLCTLRMDERIRLRLLDGAGTGEGWRNESEIERHLC